MTNLILHLLALHHNDFYSVKLDLSRTFDNLIAHGIPPKHLYLRVGRPKIG